MASRAHHAHLEEAWEALLARVNDDPNEWDKTVRRLFDRLDTDGSGNITYPNQVRLIPILSRFR